MKLALLVLVMFFGLGCHRTVCQHGSEEGGTVCCTLTNEPCGTAADCCSGSCQGNGCACGPVLALCGQASDCCNGNCVNGQCAGLSINSACVRDNDCELTVCAANKCSCVPLDASPSDNLQECCSSYALANVCRCDGTRGSGFCVGDADCCGVGSCDQGRCK